MVLALVTASVETPVIIPFRYPLNSDVEPAPGRTTPSIDVVIPYPIIAPAVVRLSVVIPIV